MRIVDVEQGSDNWLAIRLGLISASRFKDIMTNGRGSGLSVTANSYMRSLIAEVLTNQQAEISGKALEWGSYHESLAIDEYVFETGNTVESIGICLSDDRCIGASPDGFVGDDGMIEVKCPYNSTNHINTVIDGMPKDHMAQIQGNLWVNGRQWCDFISFDTRVEHESRLYVERILRDDKYIADLENKASEFLLEMKRALKQSFGIDWQGVDVESILNKTGE